MSEESAATFVLTSRQFGGSGQTPLRIDLTCTSRDQVATQLRYSDLSATTKIGESDFTYDTTGRLSNLQHKNGTGTVLANYTYTYDTGSRVLTETLGGTTKTFSYDAANQLTADGTNSISYDLAGNRTNTGYQTGQANQLYSDGTWTYSYDAEGNLIKRTKGTNAETWTYGYDTDNHLSWVEKRASDGGSLQMRADYKYDAFGNRIETDVDPDGAGAQGTTVTRFGFDGSDIWVDLNGSNALQTRRLYLDAVDSVFARIDSGGTAAWYLPDRLGSIRDLTDNSGVVQDHLDYDGFGNVLTETVASFGDR